MHRKTLNWMGNRHKDPDKEVPLDGIGGVNILVKAEVHKSGKKSSCKWSVVIDSSCRHQLPILRI